MTRLEDGRNLDRLVPLVKDAAARVVAMDNASRDAADLAVQAAIEAGKLLSACKGSMPHGKWGEWTKTTLPDISTETICRWMKLAKLSGVTDLTDADSLTEAYRRCGILKERLEPAEKEGSSGAKLTVSQAVLRASTTLQKRLRTMTQGELALDRDEQNQLRLLWDELQDLFRKALEGGAHDD